MRAGDPGAAIIPRLVGAYSVMLGALLVFAVYYDEVTDFVQQSFGDESLTGSDATHLAELYQFLNTELNPEYTPAPAVIDSGMIDVMVEEGEVAAPVDFLVGAEDEVEAFPIDFLIGSEDEDAIIAVGDFSAEHEALQMGVASEDLLALDGLIGEPTTNSLDALLGVEAEAQPLTSGIDVFEPAHGQASEEGIEVHNLNSELIFALGDLDNNLIYE